MDSIKEPITVPDFIFPDDGGRPIIKKSSSVRKATEFLYNVLCIPNHDQPPRFRPNDQVLFYNSRLNDWTGPFFVSHLKDRQYKLCNEQQKEVNDGQWVKEAALKLFDPFECKD